MPAANNETSRGRHWRLPQAAIFAAATLLCTALGFIGALSIGDQGGTAPKTSLFEVFNAKSEGTKRLGRGWSFPEAWGTWSDGPRAELTLALDKRPELRYPDGRQMAADLRSIADQYAASAGPGVEYSRLDPRHNAGH